PPMTDLEFYAALVKDYQQTAERLPTLLTNKIHKGIPPPLRGVVWQSMAGARDASLEEQYERVSNESSPYEFMISKDLSRSFPGVDMFRDAGGEGQRMLGKVLKNFSIYDREIGYCQGLAFLVGPLLMHMPDKAAFCVLVR
ncbi:MAG: TBC domain-containing protein, partial [Acidobacteria bacterium]|nr:TBC domain-containing protein [Acidobacteriota bacterium]